LNVRYGPPEPLRSAHVTADFRNGHASLVEWLQRRALSNEDKRASRTFVVCVGRAVVGYYALAAGSISPTDLPGSFRRNMPSPIPAIILARLAVDSHHQGRGLGKDLLRDAVARSLFIADSIGARVLLCHAVDIEARRFYLSCGFVPCITHQLTVMLDLGQAAKRLGLKP
jgi:GNAT superfamily N-acetyltransferase